MIFSQTANHKQTKEKVLIRVFNVENNNINDIEEYIKECSKNNDITGALKIKEFKTIPKAAGAELCIINEWYSACIGFSF